jgi:ABC-type glycerol-3-phosphate transport system permease component
MSTTIENPLEPSVASKWVAALAVIGYAVVSMIPLVWIVMTSLRTPQDAIAYPPKMVAEVSAVGYVNLFTTRSRVGAEEMAKLPPPTTWYEKLVREQQMILAGPSRFTDRYANSLLIGFGSTFLSVVLGTLAAYAFSRFRVPAKDDLLFFILSTRMMPPIAVAIPIYLMFRAVDLTDTHVGLMLLYTVVNLSLSVWLLKGFMDEIPREYEEAAAPGQHWNSHHGHLLPDLRVERICVCAVADQWQGANLAAVHPHHHRRGRTRLACDGRRDYAFPAPGSIFHHSFAQASLARSYLRRGSQMTTSNSSRSWWQRGPLWERISASLLGAGLVMLMQPWSLTLFSYSFTVVLTGVVLFSIAVKLPQD